MTERVDFLVIIILVFMENSRYLLRNVLSQSSTASERKSLPAVYNRVSYDTVIHSRCRNFALPLPETRNPSRLCVDPHARVPKRR